MCSTCLVIRPQTQTTARTESGPPAQTRPSANRARSYRNLEPAVFSSLHDLAFRFQPPAAGLAAHTSGRRTAEGGCPHIKARHGAGLRSRAETAVYLGRIGTRHRVSREEKISCARRKTLPAA